MKTFYVYIMASASRVLYVGVTNNIERRSVEHRQGRVPGFAAKHKTRELVYVEPCGDIRAAIAREKQIKGWLRVRKLALIQSRNPRWRDLSAAWHTREQAATAGGPQVVILSEAKNLSEKGNKRDSSPRKWGPRMRTGA